MHFVDTNVLLYAISRNPEELPREIANELLAHRDLALSAQVLQEFYVQATRATREDALTHQQAAQLVTAFARFPVQPTTLPLVVAAMEARRRFQLFILGCGDHRGSPDAGVIRGAFGRPQRRPRVWGPACVQSVPLKRRLVGTVDEINTEKGRVKVVVNMFGRETPVELDFLQVEKL